MTVAAAVAHAGADATLSEVREFVQVVRFRVADDNQARLIDAIGDEVERWVVACPGFVSCQMHASQDGKHVLNYARWQSEAAFRDFTSHPEMAAMNEVIRSVGPTAGPEPASYQLMRSILPITPMAEAEPLVTRATS
jgi:heme-degrading monooxygenase HmoA